MVEIVTEYKQLTLYNMPLVAPFGFYGQDAAAGPFDFVFVDGWLKDDDVKGIFEKCEDNFTFITHDYYRPEKPKPVFCKGHHVVKRMIKYAWENEYECELYPPNPDWYSAGGYYVKNFCGMNICCAMVKFSRI